MGEAQLIWFYLEGGESHGANASMEVPVVGGWLLALPPILCAPHLGNGWYQLGRVMHGTPYYVWTEGFAAAATPKGGD